MTNPPISWLGCKIANLIQTLFSAGSSTIVSNGLPVIRVSPSSTASRSKTTATVTNPGMVLSSNNCTDYNEEIAVHLEAAIQSILTRTR
jgi:hypothetical protein